jgi:hypothetical protein
MAANRKIALSYDITYDEPGPAGGVITPGMLVTVNSSGQVIAHATAGGAGSRTFALEREEMNKDIDQTYAVGDQVKTGSGGSGQRFNSLIASGQNIAKGALLESNGNGTFRLFASGVALARPNEAVNNSAGLTPARMSVTVV